jgi:transcriptional regulator with XRE-family HTH domain
MTQAQPPLPIVDAPPAVGVRLQEIRKAKRLSLDELSKRAGVSKSMLSEVERNQANPTVAVLWRLARALDISLADFLSEGLVEKPAPALTLVPSHSIPVIRSTDGKCELRILGPIDLAGKLEWYELSIQPGGILASDAHEAGTREHLSVLRGSLQVRVAESDSVVRHGETTRYAADIQHAIFNAGKSMVKAILLVEYRV